jgi:hypothetical protein
MEQERFQKLVLDKLGSHDKRFEKIEKFQDMALEYMAKMTQQLVTMDGKIDGLEGRMDSLGRRMDGLENRMTKLEILVENDVKPKIDAIFEKLAIHDDEISHLKQVK